MGGKSRMARGQEAQRDWVLCSEDFKVGRVGGKKLHFDWQVKVVPVFQGEVKAQM